VAPKQNVAGTLSGNTKVEMVAVNKETHKAFMKIIELSEFQFIKKERKFNYYLHQIGHSQYKDIIKK
jgi:hypothetical protein